MNSINLFSWLNEVYSLNIVSYLSDSSQTSPDLQLRWTKDFKATKVLCLYH